MPDPAILNWQRYGPCLTTSGQPDADELAQIAALGIATVVNLALHDHPRALPDEAAAVAALGMRYVHIPVDFEAPTEADFTTFERALDSASAAPVHVHCIVNARVSAFLYRHRRGSLGEAAARAELDRVWRPGGVWAAFVDDAARTRSRHAYAGRDYQSAITPFPACTATGADARGHNP